MEKKFNIENELDMLLDDQLDLEAELLEEYLFADDNFEDYQETQEERDASFEKLVNRLKADGIYEKEKNKEENKKEDHDTKENNVEHSVENEKPLASDGKVKDEEKSEGFKQRRYRLMKAAGVLIVSGLCIFTASMSSEANRNYWVNNFRILTGRDTKDVTDNDETNEKANVDEYAAIVEIESKLQIAVPNFYYRPESFEYSSYEIDKISGIARMVYKFKGNFVDLYMDKNHANSSTSNTNIIGNNVQTIHNQYENIQIEIEELIDEEDQLASCYAKWEYQDVTYSMYGRIGLSELKLLLDKFAY